MRKFVLLLTVFAFTAFSASSQNSPAIKLEIDATETRRNTIHVKETIPVKPGPLTLSYPKWIPGEHAPTGTLDNMVNLFIRANGNMIAWRRDDVEMFAFHCEVPAGVTELEVSFDDVEPPRTLMTPATGRLKWNRLLLYPLGAPSDRLTFSPSIKLPEGWKQATALPVKNETEETVEFKDVSLNRLVDSPVIIGVFFKRVPLATSPVLHEVDIVSDTEDGLEASEETVTGWKNLVREANFLFGAHHYDSYRFLMTLSDIGSDEGLEHHESSEDGADEDALSNDDKLVELSDLLSHEFAHSWNGKHRRPAGLVTPNFETPMRGELLWVYEGLTQYLGFVLPARSKMWTPETFRETIAITFAEMNNQSGRNWRSVADTARAVRFTYSPPAEWANARRGSDYYDEGALIWMEADILIRGRSRGKLSLDDFCRKFYGGKNTGPAVRPYDLNEVIATLNSVLPYDWRGFFNRRVYADMPGVSPDGLTRAGWKLVYNDTPNTRTAGDERIYEYYSFAYSLGFEADASGLIYDVNPLLSAAKAGLAPGMKIVSVEGEEFSVDILREAINAARMASKPIKVIAENAGERGNYSIEYHGGDLHPHLVRDATKPDLIEKIIRSH
jgi:predicted metalloprotease with PDZ domain